jgi:type IV fimbrial biogenesis protein FimT
MSHRQASFAPFPSRAARARGLSLIELMVAVAVVAVLATLGAPSFMRQMAASRLSSAATDLTAALMQARTQAITSGFRVTLCRSEDQTHCDLTSAARWDRGWIVFQDADANGARAAAETITFRVSALPGDLVVSGNQPVRDRISFRPSGQAGVSGSLRLCSTSSSLKDDERARDLVLINNGRVVSTRAAAVSSTCPPP